MRQRKRVETSAVPDRGGKKIRGIVGMYFCGEGVLGGSGRKQSERRVGGVVGVRLKKTEGGIKKPRVGGGRENGLLAPLTYLLALHCLLRTRAPLCSFVCL